MALCWPAAQWQRPGGLFSPDSNAALSGGWSKQRSHTGSRAPFDQPAGGPHLPPVFVNWSICVVMRLLVILVTKLSLPESFSGTRFLSLYQFQAIYVYAYMYWGFSLFLFCLFVMQCACVGKLYASLYHSIGSFYLFCELA